LRGFFYHFAMQIIPLVRAKYVYAYGAVLDRLGAPVRRLLEGVGLSERVLEDPEAIIPAHQAWRFIGSAAQLEGIDDLGLVAGDMSIRAYGEFSQHLFNAANLSQALDSFCALARCEYSRADFYVSLSNESVWFCRGPIDGDEIERKHVELLVLTMMIATVRLAAGQNWRPPVIYLQTSDARRVEEHHLFSSSTIRFGNRITAFEVPQRLLAEQLPEPIRLPDKGTYVRLEHEFSRALHQVVGGMLVDGIPKIRSVAEAVGGSVRTLQRRLSDMDTTFSAVIETAQMRWAVQLLERDDYTLAEIAHQLGYTDQANFTRAFRRWTGLPPGVYRRTTIQTDDACLIRRKPT
jgi:AraC-like DNA-binding protein